MKLLKWLSITGRFTKAYLDEQLAPFGINSSQYMYLVKICDQPGLTQDSLQEVFYIHPSNITRMLAALEVKEFITRSPYENDKRTCQLFPTQKALSAVAHVRLIAEAAENLLLDGLTPQEQTVFTNALILGGKNMARILHMERSSDEYDK